MTTTWNIGVNAASFVVDFPEFANQVNYPPSVVGYYLALANMLLNPCAWGGASPSVSGGQPVPVNPPVALIDFAAGLFAAHHLALEYQAQRAANGGGIPGMNTGPTSSKSLGPASQSFDNVVATLGDYSGEYNLTIYGKRFYRLADMAGMGALQLGIGGPGIGQWGLFTAASAWMGPPVWPGWFWNT